MDNVDALNDKFARLEENKSKKRVSLDAETKYEIIYGLIMKQAGKGNFAKLLKVEVEGEEETVILLEGIEQELVGRNESFNATIISNRSPVGMVLIGMKAGEENSAGNGSKVKLISCRAVPLAPLHNKQV